MFSLVLLAILAAEDSPTTFDYFRQGFSLTDANADRKFVPEIDIQVELIQSKRFLLELEQSLSFPFSQDREQPVYVLDSTRLRGKWVLSNNLKSNLVTRHESIRGEEIPFDRRSAGLGVGFENDWIGSSYALRARLETGYLRFEDTRLDLPKDYYFLEAQTDAFYALWKSAYLHLLLRLRLKAQSLSGNGGDYLKASPGLGVQFPSGTEVGFFADFIANRDSILINSSDDNSRAYGLEYRAPLRAGQNVRDTWSPHFLGELVAGMNHEGAFNEVRSELVPQLLRFGKFRLQFVIDAGFARYLRSEDGPSTSLYTLDVGPRLAWIVNEDEALSWSLDARAFHRSEHMSNPDQLENTDGPETAYIEASTPGWTRRQTVRSNSFWNWAQFAARYQVYIFVDEDRSPKRANEDYVIRLSGRVFPLAPWGQKLLRGDLFVEGQYTFLGEDPIRWRAETGWSRSNWMIFYRGESLNLGHQPAFDNRVEHFLGFRLFFLN